MKMIVVVLWRFMLSRLSLFVPTVNRDSAKDNVSVNVTMERRKDPEKELWARTESAALKVSDQAQRSATVTDRRCPRRAPYSGDPLLCLAISAWGEPRKTERQHKTLSSENFVLQMAFSYALETEILT